MEASKGLSSRFNFLGLGRPSFKAWYRGYRAIDKVPLKGLLNLTYGYVGLHVFRVWGGFLKRDYSASMGVCRGYLRT